MESKEIKFWLKNNKITQFFIMYLNGLRRWLIHKLLGDNLELQLSINQYGYIRLVDTKRRIPYYWWLPKKINARETKLKISKYKGD